MRQYSARRTRLKTALRTRGQRSLLVTHLPNIRYLTGFTGSNAVLLLAAGQDRFYTDGRYTVQAREEVRGIRAEIASGSLLKAVGERLRAAGSGAVAFEADHLSVSHKALLRASAGRKRKLVATSGLVETERERKDRGEINQIRAAARLICDVFDKILALVRPGIRETDLAAEIEYQMRKLGASGPSFETIVASGPRSALPHARPTARRLRKNELVVLDMGAILGGYCSDLTRTVYLGRAPERVRGWYRGVWEAHQAARAAVRPGARTGDVDEAARAVLRSRGLDRYFTHSTGHGIGLEIHEGPRLARGQAAELQIGNVLTIEPGVYVAGAGGIRIEDDIVVTARGAEVLTRMCGELLQL